MFSMFSKYKIIFNIIISGIVIAGVYFGIQRFKSNTIETYENATQVEIINQVNKEYNEITKEYSTPNTGDDAIVARMLKQYQQTQLRSSERDSSSTFTQCTQDSQMGCSDRQSDSEVTEATCTIEEVILCSPLRCCNEN